MTRYLLDSCIVVFWASDRGCLSKKVTHILDDHESLIYVSSDTVKELILLLQCGQIQRKGWKMPEVVVDYIVNEMNFGIKPVKEEHLRTFANLTLLRDHKDPFDRMLIAHAITENITLISSDPKFPYYARYGLDLIYNPKSPFSGVA